MTPFDFAVALRARVRVMPGPRTAVAKSGDAALLDSGFCLARTEGGGIQLRLPATASARLVSGTLGTGTGVVRLETKGGNITVTALSP
jgi:hypothetical protein